MLAVEETQRPFPWRWNCVTIGIHAAGSLVQCFPVRSGISAVVWCHLSPCFCRVLWLKPFVSPCLPKPTQTFPLRLTPASRALVPPQEGDLTGAWKPPWPRLALRTLRGQSWTGSCRPSLSRPRASGETRGSPGGSVPFLRGEDREHHHCVLKAWGTFEPASQLRVGLSS